MTKLYIRCPSCGAELGTAANFCSCGWNSYSVIQDNQNTRAPDPRLKEAIEEIINIHVSKIDEGNRIDDMYVIKRMAVDIIYKHIPEAKDE